MDEEQWKEYSTIIASPFDNTIRDKTENIRHIEFIERNYYSAFYLENTDNSKREVPSSFVPYFNGIWLGTATDIKDDPYQMHVKFNNYASLEDVQYRYENFYLCRVFKLVDLYENNAYLTTGYNMQFWVVNDLDEVCFFDYLKRSGESYFAPQYLENPKYVSYFDEDQYTGKNIVPFFPHPYGKTTPMVTRDETDGGYIYSPFLTGGNNVYNYEVVYKEKMIKQYNSELQKSVTVQINYPYLKVPISNQV